MVAQFMRSWFGDFNREELKKFLILAFIFALTIGAYWLLRPLKDSVFSRIIGIKENQPYAKILSLFVVVPLAMVYGKLVDLFPRHRLFYVLATIYSVLALVFAWYLLDPEIGLPNTQASPWRMIGWFFYVYVESFGSLMVALFWAFAADTTTPESAKRGFPIITAGAQAGGVLGPLAVYMFVERVGSVALLCVGASIIFSIVPLIYWFMKSVPQTDLQGFKATEKTPKKGDVGFAEGLKLMLAQPYLLGIFAVIFIFDLINTVFDYRFKIIAESVHHGEAMTTVLGLFGVLTNLVALICVLVGVNNIGRKLGLTVALIILPFTVGLLSIVSLWQSLYIAMGVNIVAKALNYALNQPSKEQLYIPMSKDAKYKAKAWVEMFGSRGSKAAGSGINTTAKFLGDYFVPFVTVVSLGLVGVWIMIAIYLGRTHKGAVEQNKVIC